MIGKTWVMYKTWIKARNQEKNTSAPYQTIIDIDVWYHQYHNQPMVTLFWRCHIRTVVQIPHAETYHFTKKFILFWLPEEFVKSMLYVVTQLLAHIVILLWTAQCEEDAFNLPVYKCNKVFTRRMSLGVNYHLMNHTLHSTQAWMALCSGLYSFVPFY